MTAIIQVYGSMLLEALGRTLLMTLLALIFAMIIGMIFGLMNVGHNRGAESDRHGLCGRGSRRSAYRTGVFCVFWYSGRRSAAGLFRFPSERITGGYYRVVHELWRVYG